MSTDLDWEQWGARDPYYGVLTNPIFRRAAFDDNARNAFFASGRRHVDEVLAACREKLDPSFEPQSVLDFGCGVGRLLVAFARSIPLVVGVDVSASMLLEARRNCDQRGFSRVVLFPSDDELSAIPGDFDFVHSAIVLQHIPIERGRKLFGRLVDLIRPGGLGAIQVTFGCAFFGETFGQEPPPVEPPPPPATLRLVQASRAAVRSGVERVGLRAPPPPPPPAEVDPDPQMQMHYYNLSELTWILHTRGVTQVHTQVTDHGGALGAFLFFRAP